jgi:ankyrin repeat protein
VRVLLEHGASASARTKFYDTAIYAAAQIGCVEIIKLLVEHGADVNDPNEEYTTPLMVAAGGGHGDAVRALLAAGARVKARDRFKLTALHYAARAGAFDASLSLVDAGALIDTQTEDRVGCQTPLLYAATIGHFDLVAFLVGRGASITQSGRGRETALFLAASNGHAEVVRFLLDSGSQADTRCSFSAPLTAAIKGGHSEVVRQLLFAGVDLKQLKNCISMAVESGAIDVIPLLIAADADIDAVGDPMAMTALMNASARQLYAVVALLLAGGANVEFAQSLRSQCTRLCDGWQCSPAVCRVPAVGVGTGSQNQPLSARGWHLTMRGRRSRPVGKRGCGASCVARQRRVGAHRATLPAVR